MTAAPISVVIPSFNGRPLLEEYLPTVVAALDKYSGGGEIIVVEDGGGDGTIGWLRENHPKAKGILLEKNRGFAVAANTGVKAATSGVVMMLNNDMALEGDFFTPIMKRISSADDIFAVTAASILSFGGNESPNRAEYDDGLIMLKQPGLDPAKRHDRAATVFLSAGGYSAYRREKFLELGGFDPIFAPFYWEDVDLCYRAWRRGMRCVYEPASRLNHKSHGTIGAIHDREKYDMIHHAHQHLFHLVNLEEADLERYIRRMNDVLVAPNLYDNGVLRRGFYIALKKMDGIIARREKIASGVSLTEIVERSSLVPLEGN